MLILKYYQSCTLLWHEIYILFYYYILMFFFLHSLILGIKAVQSGNSLFIVKVPNYSTFFFQDWIASKESLSVVEKAKTHAWAPL